MMKFVRFTYKGDKWNAYAIPKEEMAEFVDDLVDDSTAAQVEFDKKEIYFSDNYLDMDTILHELFHVATGYQYVQDSNLDFLQSEELFCNIFSYEGENLLKLGKELFKLLKELKDTTEDELTLEVKIE